MGFKSDIRVDTSENATPNCQMSMELLAKITTNSHNWINDNGVVEKERWPLGSQCGPHIATQ